MSPRGAVDDMMDDTGGGFDRRTYYDHLSSIREQLSAAEFQTHINFQASANASSKEIISVAQYLLNSSLPHIIAEIRECLVANDTTRRIRSFVHLVASPISTLSREERLLRKLFERLGMVVIINRSLGRAGKTPVFPSLDLVGSIRELMAIPGFLDPHQLKDIQEFILSSTH